jgi:hypothetical protein
LEGIRVAVDHERDDRIASTVRVFVRRALVDGRHVPCGGIGSLTSRLFLTIPPPIDMLAQVVHVPDQVR